MFSRPRLIGILAATLLLAHPQGVRAQSSIEISPAYGYLFGNDIFEAFTGPLTVDGAASLGAVVDVPLSNGFQIEGLFSHQATDAVAVPNGFGRPQSLRISVNHYQAGGVQEYNYGRVRPFVTGTLGLTDIAIEASHEVRFTLGGGGGVKLFPSSNIGVRLDGRLLATFIDAGSTTLVCASPGATCLVGLHLNMAWQAAFTAGVVFKIK